MNPYLTHEHLEKLEHKLQFLSMVFHQCEQQITNNDDDDELAMVKHDRMQNLSVRIIDLQIEIDALKEYLET